MKYFIYPFVFFVFLSGIYPSDHGYYMYKFEIDKNDNISLHTSNHVDSKLKTSKIQKHIHNSILYKIKNNESDIIFEGEIDNPRIIHFEDFIGSVPSKTKVVLENSFFVVKVPNFSDIDKIEFYKSDKHDLVFEKLSEIKLTNNINNSTREIFPVTDIMVNGSNDARVNIVFLGDGYKQNQMDQYISDVEEVTDDLFNTIPYSNYMNYFNVYAVEVPSEDSGTDHPGTAPDCGGYNDNVFYADTYFDSSFDLYNIHRLLYIQDQSAAFDVLADNVPDWDIIFVMVNTTMYGGAGGTFAVFSRHASSSEIAIHEIGHSFAGLADEYWAGFNYAGEYANMTANNNPETIVWNSWLYDNGVGIYSHNYPGNEWYKPHQNCKMQFLGPPFCSVCVEHTIKSVYDILEPINSYYPENLEVVASASELVYFGIEPILNFPNTLSINWFIDNQLIAEDVEDIELETYMYSLGEHEVKVIIEDFTDLVRNDSSNLLKSEFVWNLIIECNTSPDLNNDNQINIQDVIILVNHILDFSSEIECIDLNEDGLTNVLDVIFIINRILD
tara:strand:- start:48 stop:1715 length:1668 start_codon:yes stop_codon:yes gene_type:complete